RGKMPSASTRSAFGPITRPATSRARSTIASWSAFNRYIEVAPSLVSVPGSVWSTWRWESRARNVGCRATTGASVSVDAVRNPRCARNDARRSRRREAQVELDRAPEHADERRAGERLLPRPVEQLAGVGVGVDARDDPIEAGVAFLA